MEVGAVWKLGWGSGLSLPLLFLKSLRLVILQVNEVTELEDKSQERDSTLTHSVFPGGGLMATPPTLAPLREAAPGQPIGEI